MESLNQECIDLVFLFIVGVPDVVNDHSFGEIATRDFYESQWVVGFSSRRMWAVFLIFFDSYCPMELHP